MRARGSLAASVLRRGGLFATWLPLLIWMGVIFFLSGRSSTPSINAAWLDLLLKKGGHFIEFFILAVLALRIARPGARMEPRTMLAALALAVAYAAFDELHQSFVPGRHATWVDATIDSFGALFGALAGARAFGGGRHRFGSTDIEVKGLAREG